MRESRAPTIEVQAEAADDVVDARIERLDAHRFRVDRALLQDALRHTERLGARLDLSGSDGRRGLVLAFVDPRGVLARLGLSSGDRIESINGYELGNAESGLVALARLASASELRARVIRQGKPLAWTARIE
jgi:S1-C subfamily serine protease